MSLMIYCKGFPLKDYNVFLLISKNLVNIKTVIEIEEKENLVCNQFSGLTEE